MVSFPAPDMLSGVKDNLCFQDDGTLIDGQTDTTGNPRALVPYGIQPDPIVSQQAIVATGTTSEDNTRTLVVRQAAYGLSESAITYAERWRDNLIQEISIQEDGTMYGPGIDEEVVGRRRMMWLK